MKHTSGPWRWIPYASREGGKIINEKRMPICSFYNEPNAYDVLLISAAPDLLETAKHYLNVTQRVPLSHSDTHAKAKQDLEDAIAKAENK